MKINCCSCKAGDLCCLSPECFTEVDVSISYGSVDERISGLICLKCNLCFGIRRNNGSFDPLSNILNSGLEIKPNGWEASEDYYRHSILKEISYRINESPNSKSFECKYGRIEPQMDKLFLLWHGGISVGFCTLRTWQSCLPTLDSVFVSRSARFKGYGSSILSKLLSAENELGLSEPVSNAMIILGLKLLKKKSKFRDKLWIAKNSNFINFWWNAPKICKERSLDLLGILK